MPTPHEKVRIAIAGASSLQGKDLKQYLEESGFPAGEVRLLDEEFAAGTLTEAGGEPALIETVSEESFEGVRFAFFAGTPGFSRRHADAARRAGATVLDLSRGLAEHPDARFRIPALEPILAPPAPKTGGGLQSLFLAPSAPADAAISLSAACAPLGLVRLVLTFFQPVSERGPEGIEELERQVAKLLLFERIPQEVYDTQVAFNMLSAYGAGSAEKLADIRAGILGEVRAYLAGRSPLPVISLVQAPVFHAHAFTAYAEFSDLVSMEDLAARLRGAGLKVAGPEDDPPTNVSVAEEPRPVIALPERDPGIEHGVWMWGAADNFRVPVATAIAIAEKLIAS